MPMYEYRCAACAHSFETYRRAIERGEPVECPGCGESTQADRLWSTIAVRVTAGKARPRSGAEALAGPGARGLGATAGHRATSLLQTSSCGGVGHRH
jgi:putative FmdB family regulatory protein